MAKKEKLIIIIDDAEGEFNTINQCIKENTFYTTNSYAKSCELRKALIDDFSGQTFINWIKSIKQHYNIVAIMIDIEFLPKGNDKTGLKLFQFFREHSVDKSSDERNFYEKTPIFIISKHDDSPMKGEAHSGQFVPNGFISKNNNELCEGKLINKVKKEIEDFLSPQQSNKKEFYKQWWVISLVSALFIGFIVGYVASCFYIGLVTVLAIFLIILFHNPERRFFRKANFSLIFGLLHMKQYEIFFYNSNYGFIKIGGFEFPWLGLCLLILSAFLFYLDYKKDNIRK